MTAEDVGGVVKAALELFKNGGDLAELRPLMGLARLQAFGLQADLDYMPRLTDRAAPLAQKLTSAHRAASLIKSRSTVISSGFGGVGRPSVLYRALKEIAISRQRPLGLTWVTVSAAGARGRAEGSLEELAEPGLIARYISGHVETVKAFFPLAETGKMIIHTLPQGVMASLIAAQSDGVFDMKTTVGIDTFLDPAMGGEGTELANANDESLVTRAGNELIYRLPQLDVALISAAAVDQEGNVYGDGMASITEIADAVRAVRHNNGVVIVAVGYVTSEPSGKPLIPTEFVNHIVVHPRTEQIAGIPVTEYWDIFTPKTPSPTVAAFTQAHTTLKFVNTLANVTPARGEFGQVLARTAAKLLTENIRRNDLVNIGVGLPEEVAGIFCDAGLAGDVLFSVESGALGGIPSPGLFFGSAIHPQKIESSRETFARYRRGLPAAVLGFLEVDGKGNVNVSRRGSQVSGIIGPGGFIDICEAAQTIIFVGSWMVRGKTIVENGNVKIDSHGQPKFVPKLGQVTFSAARALKAGKRVYYVTDFGILRLSGQGLILHAVFPGIDRKEDIERTMQIAVVGMSEAQTICREIVTGDGFNLSIRD